MHILFGFSPLFRHMFATRSRCVQLTKIFNFHNDLQVGQTRFYNRSPLVTGSRFSSLKKIVARDASAEFAVSRATQRSQYLCVRDNVSLFVRQSYDWRRGYSAGQGDRLACEFSKVVNALLNSRLGTHFAISCRNAWRPSAGTVSRCTMRVIGEHVRADTARGQGGRLAFRPPCMEHMKRFGGRRGTARLALRPSGTS